MTGKLFGIRRAQPGDVTRIHSLILIATRRGKIIERSLRNIRNSIHHFFVVEQNEKVVACCSIEVYNKKLAEIRSLAVDPVNEKMGLASLLVRRCVSEAKKRKVYEVLVITDRENIFRRHGFSEQLHGQKSLFLRP